MDLIKRIINAFRKPPEAAPDQPDRAVRELLREILSTIPVDVFYPNDPLVGMTDEQRKVYLKKFYDIVLDGTLIGLIKYLVNNQANITLQAASPKEIADGAMTINGMALVKDKIEALSTMFIKENSPAKDTFNKMGI